MVTNYMDIVLGILLITEILLGLWVAYEYRWGSSWFAIVLTPYLIPSLILIPKLMRL